MLKSRGGKKWRGWCTLRRMDLKAQRHWYAEFMARDEIAEQHLKEALAQEKVGTMAKTNVEGDAMLL